MSNLISVYQIVVNYSMFGQDEGYPVTEAIGTLIFGQDGQWYIKETETGCRLAAHDEVIDWVGPTAPWFVTVGNIAAFQNKKSMEADVVAGGKVEAQIADPNPAGSVPADCEL